MKKWVERTLVAAALAFVVWFYYWTVEANDGFDDWGEADYFRLLVRGWRKGQLHLDKAPSPELLALADPYDPLQNSALRLPDASLYKGKYYLYFGPVPAATLMLPYTLLTGREMKMGEAALAFATLGFLAASGLWLALRRRYFPESSLGLAPLGVLVIGFGTHLLALAQRPLFWEVSIGAGVAFAMLSAGAVYRAVHGRRPQLAMALAGLGLGLAVGSRPTWLLALPMLLAPLWLAWRERHPARDWRRLALAAVVPLGLCGLALMAYNYARFDNPLEWGQRYQLSGAYESKLTHFSARFFPHNILVYFFQPPHGTWEFPFVHTVGLPTEHIPDYFGTEEVAGLALTFPHFWFLLALPLAWWRRSRREGTELSAIAGGLAGGTLPIMGLIFCYFSNTTRYQADFAVALAIVALLGLLSLERWARRRGRLAGWTVRGLGGVVCAFAVPMGMLMSFDYHRRTLEATRSPLWRELDRTAQEVIATAGRWVGRVTGPRVYKVTFRAQPAGQVETFWQSADPRAAERILVEHLGEQLIRFGFARGSAPVEWGPPLRWESDHLHTVSVQAPSLYPPKRDDVWARLIGRTEFRARTSAAVWFSGGPALGVVVGELPTDIRPGGTIGADFTGRVRRETTRLYGHDEVAGGLADPAAPRGGVLRLRLMVPWRLRERGEPIFVAGAHDRSTMIYLRSAPGGVRFVFENYPAPRVESEVVAVNPAGHWLELEMASFRPEAFGTEATGDVVVRLDGREILRTRQLAYGFPPGTEKIGENPFGYNCELEFGGWLYDARWVR